MSCMVAVAGMLLPAGQRHCCSRSWCLPSGRSRIASQVVQLCGKSAAAARLLALRIFWQTISCRRQCDNTAKQAGEADLPISRSIRGREGGGSLFLASRGGDTLPGLFRG